MALDIGFSITSFLIPSGQALSAGVAIGAQRVRGLAIPAAWSPASITFQCSIDGGATWLEFVDQTGSAITVTNSAAGQFVALTEEVWSCANHFKIRSGTLGSPVNQAADRTLQLVLRDFV
jgi:hypothetical protein